MALQILAVTSEAFPLAKTGGLGDAVSGMVSVIQAMGADVTLMLPAYRGVKNQLLDARLVGCLKGLPGGDARLIKGRCPGSGSGVLLLENDALFDRDRLYIDAYGAEYPDSALRFAALSHAAARVAAGIPGVALPDIVHAHDWHAALTPLIMRQLGVTRPRTILTLHNIAFQGSFCASMAEVTGVDPSLWASGGLLQGDRINFLHAGIAAADKITVVSTNYAREILTSEFGCGLDGLLRARQADLISVPNGIDASLWNPATDIHLQGSHFDLRDMKNKGLCKRRLQAQVGLREMPDAPLLVMGSRLTGQKMADVAVNAIPLMMDAHPDLQVCVMGQGEKSIEANLQKMGQRYPGRCAIQIGFSEEAAHLLHAGADMLLHGSRFEPFGLTPLYSMRYGTIPIGSRVGGMVDTICDPGFGGENQLMYGATGLLFQGDQVQDMCAAIERAVGLFRNKSVWLTMRRNAMQRDFSWERAAPAYMQLYQTLCPVHSNVLDRQQALEYKSAPITPTMVGARPAGMTAGSRLQRITRARNQVSGELAPSVRRVSVA